MTHSNDTLNDILDGAAEARPDFVGLVAASQDGTERSVTFEELRRLVLKAAAGFRARGIAKGDCVSIVHRNGLEFITAYFALVRLGAIAVPINFMVQKAEELRFMLDHCGAKGVVTQREFLPGLMAAKRFLPELERVWCSDERRRVRPDRRADAPRDAALTEDFWTFVEAHAPLEEQVPVSPEDVIAVLYTSGTTGRPKGVMLTHSNLVSNCDSSIRAMSLRQRDVTLTILPMFHTFAWTACVVVPLRLGAKNVIASSIAPPKPWLKLMARHGATLFAAVPQVYAVLVKQAFGLKRLALRYWFFRKVRMFISGAAPLTAHTAGEFREAFGGEITEGYGLTETSPVATINPPGAQRPGSVGRPIEDVDIRVVDDDGNALPTGAEGEICIRGPNVMKGYLRDEAATRAAISQEGWFKTGDIGALDRDGYLYIRDRKKDMIIVKGLKVFSAQVEAVIACHPDVSESAVIGIPDPSGDETIKAFVVLREGAAADKSELLKFCRSRLDPYKRPRDVEIVDELPKNALQKVLKRVLRERELKK